MNQSRGRRSGPPVLLVVLGSIGLAVFVVPLVGLLAKTPWSQLPSLLASDVGMWSDGGGKVSAARRPLVGRSEVLNFLIGVQRTAETAGLTRDASLTIEDVNSEPALVLRVGQRLESVFVLSIEDETISAIRAVRNPDKLAHIDRQLAMHSG